MDEKAFKKMLIDLEWTRGELGEAAGLSGWAITLYVRGELDLDDRRARIRDACQARALELGVTIPTFWEDAAA